ncbi:MAG TPA: monovalent cation/H(+) antiporter subunit G [Xanthomonadaceae bacterium]|nr:monovalent cation/H(+) antiporter subunit G [Xanthomonadaceae bacterium]
MGPIDILAAALLGAGALLGLIGGIGVLRFPDFYTRLHAAGITDTLCAALFLGGVALHLGDGLAALRLALIFAFLMFTSPTACHALARAARQGGLEPWQARPPGEPR